MFGQGSPPNTIQCFGIEIVEDQEVEGDEFFTLLVQSQQAVIAQARTIIRITIRDNDGTYHTYLREICSLNLGSPSFCICVIMSRPLNLLLSMGIYEDQQMNVHS